MTKFNIGDRVSAYDKCYKACVDGPITATVITDNRCGGYIVELDVPYTTITRLFFTTDEMTILEEPKVTFKIGDRVRVVKGSDYTDKIRAGLTGIVVPPLITRGQDEGATYVRFDEPGVTVSGGWFFYSEHDGAIEKIEEPVANPRATRAAAPVNRKVLKHLQAGKTISPMEAIIIYGVIRLAPAIHDLRAAGHIIKTELRKDRQGKRYARYQLAA